MYLMRICLLLGLAVVANAKKIAKAEEVVLADVFYCRMVWNNVSERIAALVRDQEFNPQFELASVKDPFAVTTAWLGADVVDDPKTAAVLYKLVGLKDPSDIVGLNYPFAYDFIDKSFIKEGHLEVRCSNGSVLNSTNGLSIKFTKSYKVRLGRPQPFSRVQHTAKLEELTRVDCYDRNGYQDPYTLDPVHRYIADGEKFQVGCFIVLACDNGAFGGVDRCPLQRFTEAYRPVRIPGQCCDSAVKTAAVENAGCPKGQTESSFQRPSPKTKVPWQVRLRKPDGSACDGVIASKRWFITTKSCLSDGTKFEFERPAGIKYQPYRFRNITVSKIEVKSQSSDKNLDLVLAKISEPFIIDDWTTAIQKVNLPWSEAVCKRFLQQNCHLILGTEQRDADAGAPSTVLAIADAPSKSLPVQTVQKIYNEPVLLGSGAVGWYDKAHFLVGIYVGNVTAAASDKSSTGNLISICGILDSIKKTVKNDD